MGIAHVAVDLGAGDEGGNGVDDDEIDAGAPGEWLRDVEGLLAAVGLGDEQPIEIDADGLGVAVW